MLAFKREALALVVLTFYFLVLDQQTQESRLQQLLLLQHLKRSRRKRLILLQIALCKTRRVRRACEARALRARKTLTPRFTDFFTDFEKKNDCFAVYWRNNARINNHRKKEIFIMHKLPIQWC